MLAIRLNMHYLHCCGLGLSAGFRAPGVLTRWEELVLEIKAELRWVRGLGRVLWIRVDGLLCGLL